MKAVIIVCAVAIAPYVLMALTFGASVDNPYSFLVVPRKDNQGSRKEKPAINDEETVKPTVVPLFPDGDPQTVDKDGVPVYSEPTLPQWEQTGVSYKGTAALSSRLPGKMRHLANAFCDAGDQHGICAAFLAAIARHETGDGTSVAYRKLNNCMGVMTSGGRKLKYFRTKAESIYYMAHRLTTRSFYTKHRHNIEGIARVYCPVGAKNDPRGYNKYWPSAVRRYLKEMNPRSPWLGGYRTSKF